eukprot:TRINITY_DN3000_c0_g1_i7.p1 TRINITY_DN3000_c0_g1~~TRINITY_DN3000_c0_g1_i7.p1  ORF type:complete len:671 (+),score=97.01 TRINITY_DN3000_c0_g1_i7:899-2911(+)
MDHLRKIEVIQPSDPRVLSSPVIGIWTHGCTDSSHPYIWSACNQFIFDGRISQRITIEDGMDTNFLLVTLDGLEKKLEYVRSGHLLPVPTLECNYQTGPCEWERFSFMKTLRPDNMQDDVVLSYVSVPANDTDLSHRNMSLATKLLTQDDAAVHKSATCNTSLHGEEPSTEIKPRSPPAPISVNAGLYTMIDQEANDDASAEADTRIQRSSLRQHTQPSISRDHQPPFAAVSQSHPLSPKHGQNLDYDAGHKHGFQAACSCAVLLRQQQEQINFLQTQLQIMQGTILQMQQQMLQSSTWQQQISPKDGFVREILASDVKLQSSQPQAPVGFSPLRARDLGVQNESRDFHRQSTEFTHSGMRANEGDVIGLLSNSALLPTGHHDSNRHDSFPLHERTLPSSISPVCLFEDESVVIESNQNTIQPSPIKNPSEANDQDSVLSGLKAPVTSALSPTPSQKHFSTSSTPLRLSAEDLAQNESIAHINRAPIGEQTSHHRYDNSGSTISDFSLPPIKADEFSVLLPVQHAITPSFPLGNLAHVPMRNQSTAALIAMDSMTRVDHHNSPSDHTDVVSRHDLPQSLSSKVISSDEDETETAQARLISATRTRFANHEVSWSDASSVAFVPRLKMPSFTPMSKIVRTEMHQPMHDPRGSSNGLDILHGLEAKPIRPDL